jgi:sugar phosphate isomerase/epimerase
MSIANRLAVCTWSLQPSSAAGLVALLDEVGLRRVQLHLDPFIEEAWEPGEVAGLECVSGMVTCVGEDYSSIAAIHRTGGVVPDETWPATRERIRRAGPVAAGLGIRLITLHAGFIPADAADPVFAIVRDRLAEAADLLGEHGVALGLETGQESADDLLRLLDALGREDVGVNFDPANMILYGSGDPIDALKKLRPRVVQAHLKDALPSDQPGVQWGSEVVVGTGAVDWPAFFELIGDDLDLPIEREAGENRVADIRAAAEFVRRR